MGREDGREDIAAVGCEGVAMSGVDFANDPVSAKHAEQSRDFGGTSTFFLRRIDGSSEEERLKITVAETVSGELAARNDFAELRIFSRPGTQSANLFVVVEDRLTDAANPLAQRGVGIHRGEGIEVA